MTAVTSRVVRFRDFGMTPELDEPDIYGHVVRTGPLTVVWSITEGRLGETLASGRTWTKGGAWTAAIAAAHRAGVR